MSAQSVTFSTYCQLNCGVCGTSSNAILCVPGPLTTDGSGFVQATFTDHQTSSVCGNCDQNTYSFSYDDAQLTDPATPLNSGQVNSAFCTDCLTSWLEAQSSFVPLYLNATPVSTVTTGSETLYSYTLPANTISTNNERLLVRVVGKSGGSGNVSPSITFGGSTIFTAAGFVGTHNFDVTATIIRTGSAVQVILVCGQEGSSSVVGYTQSTTTTKDFTTDLVVSFTGISTVAGQLTGLLFAVDKILAP